MKRSCRDGRKALDVLLMFLSFRIADGHLSCYFGTINETESSNQSLIQQPCSEHYSTASTEMQKSYKLAELKNVSGEQVKFCLVFMYEVSHYVHSCDYEDICSAEGIHQRLQYEGQTGIALCCKQHLCNSPERTKELALQSFNSSCYMNSVSDVSCEGLACMNRTTFDSNGKIIQLEYGCENETTSKKEGCQEMSLRGDRIVTCVCAGHYCNHPEEIFNTLVASSTVFPLVVMTNPFYVQRQSERSMTFVATFIGVLVLLVFSLILIGFGIRKFREHRIQHQAYTYTQLTADFAEERDTDDEYMLIG